MTKAQIKDRILQLQSEIAVLQCELSRIDGVTKAPAPVLTDELATCLEYFASGKSHNRWVHSHLSDNDMLEIVSDDGYWQITDKGRDALKTHQASKQRKTS